MMNVTMSEVVAVSTPVLSLVDLGAAVDELSDLQKRAAEIERRAKVLRGEVREGMARWNMRKFASVSGHTATIIDSTSWRGDREAAERLLSAAIVSEIFRPTTSTTLRIK
jgi:hypothetical protein